MPLGGVDLEAGLGRDCHRRLHLDHACHLHLLSSLHRSLTFTLRMLSAASVSATSDLVLALAAKEA
jgi:hypothetical protein